MFLVLSFNVFSFTKSKNRRRVEQVLQGGGGGQLAPVWGAGRKTGRRMNMVQTMYTHACKCKTDTCGNCSRNQGRVNEGEKWKGGIQV
jgi:hypothetical protein